MYLFLFFYVHTTIEFKGQPRGPGLHASHETFHFLFLASDSCVRMNYVATSYFNF